MPRWPRPQNLTRLFVGQHIINGVSVGLGVVAVALVASEMFGFVASQPATLGAISASISDLPAPWREKARTLVFGFALAMLSTIAMQVALPWPVAAILMIGIISFVGGLVTGLGRWAVAVGMQAVIPMVFILGFPRETYSGAVHTEMLFAGGGVAYIAIALLATVFTDASGRRMVASETIREFSIYLRAVAGVFDPDQDLAAAYGAVIRQQSALSDQLQSARALLLERPGKMGERMRLAASIGILLDALDALIAAQCDVELMRNTPEAAPVLARIGDALRVGSSRSQASEPRASDHRTPHPAARPSACDRRPQPRDRRVSKRARWIRKRARRSTPSPGGSFGRSITSGAWKGLCRMMRRRGRRSATLTSRLSFQSGTTGRARLRRISAPTRRSCDLRRGSRSR